MRVRIEGGGSHRITPFVSAVPGPGRIHMTKLKSHRVLLPAAGAIIAAGIGAAMLYAHLSAAPTVTEPTMTTSTPAVSRHRLHMKGVRYDGISDGKKTFTVRADRFTVDKKKVGFFRISALNTVRLVNARIDVYARSPGAPAHTSAAPDTPRDTNPHPGAAPPAAEIGMPLHLPEELTDGTIVLPGRAPVTEVVMEPVEIRVYEGEALAAVISASRATVDARNRALVFTGNVHARFGERNMVAQRLTLGVDKNGLRVIGMEPSSGRSEGNASRRERPPDNIPATYDGP